LAVHAQSGSATWQASGNDLTDSRSQSSENTISPSNVSKLTPMWSYTTQGDVSVTPTVDSTAVYFPDWGGNMYAVDRNTGKLIWTHTIATYNGVSGSVSRNSPAIYGKDIIFGDVQSTTKPHSGANVIAVSRDTGTIHWMTKVDSHLAAVITGPPVVAGNIVLVGVSSSEESLADQAGYVCCTFRGSIVALNADTGKMMWQRYTVPDNGGQTGGYSGGAVWQPAAVDISRGIAYIGTGNNYTAPQSVEDCQTAATAGQTASCFDPEDFFDTELAININSGSVLWNKRLQGSDIWTVACSNPMSGTICPKPTGPDFDLGGSGPNLLPNMNMLAVGQKSGFLWGLDTSNGNVTWGTQVGPGSTSGGIEWGTASDGQRVYVAISNNLHNSYKLAKNGPDISWGSWAGINAQTGEIQWQTADPTQGAADTGAVSVANGVVYAGSYSGFMYALSANDGSVLWSFDSGGSVVDSPSIANGMLFWGSGYGRSKPGKSNNKLYAFGVPQ
jgi:polyvinyl alcohol dehydrogenase (cytochrome)